ncbi:translation initiation factor IF-2-like [Manacus candei]|uniref:translation initiation factor IF-2-like n=1 Tax=Manacus candei TaxID=415023 RepID=UPI002225C35D|nr:translation initiation factor IF-2-like [Manacus candei]
MFWYRNGKFIVFTGHTFRLLSRERLRGVGVGGRKKKRGSGSKNRSKKRQTPHAETSGVLPAARGGTEPVLGTTGPAPPRLRKPAPRGASGALPGTVPAGGGRRGQAPPTPPRRHRCHLAGQVTPAAQPRPARPRACAPALRSEGEAGARSTRQPEPRNAAGLARSRPARLSLSLSLSPSLRSSLPIPLPLLCSPARPRHNGREDLRRPRGRLTRPIGARGALPALGGVSNRRAAGEGPRAGLGQRRRHRPPTRKKKKNDGSAEAQKARGETAARRPREPPPRGPESAGVPAPPGGGARRPRRGGQRLPCRGSWAPPLVPSRVTSGAP